MITYLESGGRVLVECTTILPSYSTHSWPKGECVMIVMFLSKLGLDALISELAFLFLGVTLAMEGSPISRGFLGGSFPFFLCHSMASWVDNLKASSSSFASYASSYLGSYEWVSDCPLVNSTSSSSRALKCFRMSSSVSKDMVRGWLGVILGVGVS